MSKRFTLLFTILAVGAVAACSENGTPARPVDVTPGLSLTTVPGPGDPIPTGQRVAGGSVLEPVYDAEHAGAIGFVSTPMHAPLNANPKSWSPLYVVMYPVTTTVETTFLCQHQPVENCPSHGDALAGLAQQAEPGVYGAGVIGHDHLMDYPGGDEFDVAWEPIVVLFTNSAAANHHLLTEGEIEAAVARGDAIEIPLPDATFHCEPVPASVWSRTVPLS